MCGFRKLRVRIARFFGKKKKATGARQALELGQISHPHEVRRVDSKGNPVNSQDGPVGGTAIFTGNPVTGNPVTGNPVTGESAVVDGTPATGTVRVHGDRRPIIDTAAMMRGVPLLEGSAVTDGTSTSGDTTRNDGPPAADGTPATGTKVEAKEDAGGTTAGPAPKDI